MGMGFDPVISAVDARDQSFGMSLPRLAPNFNV